MLAPQFIKDPGVVGQVLALFDSGLGMTAVCQKAIDLGLVQALAGSASADALVALLFKNVLGTVPDAAQTSSLTAYLDGRVASYSPAELMALVAQSDLNQAQIGLVGLQQTGLEYIG